MGKIIAIANQKGGAGETTTTLNLSTAIAEKNKKVLLVNCDPQASLTISCGIEMQKLEKFLYDAIKEEIRHKRLTEKYGRALRQLLKKAITNLKTQEKERKENQKNRLMLC